MNQAEIEKKLEELRAIGMAALPGRRREQPAPLTAQIGSMPDPYADRMRAALREINRPDYPAGMILWLGEAHPKLYDELTSRIPDEIHLAWTARAPLDEFDRILARLVETHSRACALYREHPSEQAQTEPTSAPKTSQSDSGTPKGEGEAR